MTTPSPFRSSRRECDWVPGRVHLKALAQRVETEATKPEDVYVYESLFERLRRESPPMQRTVPVIENPATEW
jgi:hypothetical protein